MNFSNSFCNKVSITCIFNQDNLFNILIHFFPFSIFEFYGKQALICLLKILL